MSNSSTMYIWQHPFQIEMKPLETVLIEDKLLMK